MGLFEDLPIFEIPWRHNILLNEKVKDCEERLWYAEQSMKNGWTRRALEDWIGTNLYGRQGKGRGECEVLGYYVVVFIENEEGLCVFGVGSFLGGWTVYSIGCFFDHFIKKMTFVYVQ